ncbi:MAG TPA: hypothetical protein EYH31_06710, partial [Anaerolineae bacterium]|nr:hypothetical protein [Anaerolineae bacterium]
MADRAIGCANTVNMLESTRGGALTGADTSWLTSVTGADSTCTSATAAPEKQRAVDLAAAEKGYQMAQLEEASTQTDHTAAVEAAQAAFDLATANADLTWTQTTSGEEKTYKSSAATELKNLIT